MNEPIRFRSEAGPVETVVSPTGPDPDAPGVRIRVDIDAATLASATAADAFELASTIPGGVPVPDESAPVTLELRLDDEHDALLADSSREPGVLLGDMVGATAAGRDEYALLSASAWQVAQVHQAKKRFGRGGLDLVTLHDFRPAVAARGGEAEL